MNPSESSSFQSFGLSEPLMKAMNEMGFTSPTPIQEKAIPLLLGEAQDMIGLASTGTGKTAAFGIPLIEKIDASLKATQGLVLSPTRELALQVADQLQKLGKYKGVRVVTIYGGSSYRTQIEGVRKGAHIVVATPGRLVDFLEQKVVQLTNVQTLILDEADEMISMGFKDDLEFILKHTHNEEAEASGRAACKTWLFSATMSRDIRRVADTYLEAPETIEVAKPTGSSDLVKQSYYTVKDEHKNEVISRLLQIHDNFHGIIFCQTKMEVIELEEKLQRRGFSAASLHGDKQQKEREITLRKFRSGEAKVLVATDVAARGLDVKDLTHVINHSLPWDVESYIHRIGRTGRNGKEGIAISLINPRQVGSLRRIQNVTKKTLEKGKIPTSDEVAMIRLQKFMSQLVGVPTEGRKYQIALQIFEELVQKDESGLLKLAPPELLARVITAIHPELLAEKDYDLDFMKGGLDQRRDFKPRGDRPERGDRFDRGGDRGDRGPRQDRPRRDDRGPYAPRAFSNDRTPAKKFGPRKERAEGDDRGFAPRKERTEGESRGAERSFAPRKERAEGGERSFAPRKDRGGEEQRDFKPRTDRNHFEDGFPRRDRGPRFDGFSFGDGGGEKRKDRKESKDRPERADRPRRADPPGVKRHRSGGSKRRFSNDNA
ncbi:DEAD/DEAH box helicase [Bdellovibrio sp. HCB337]|uniref:DEAD/DEAH box helicase n=1 Tax=Bdellovibrio sp. HCB337 TaxID=3394358 RepID=UPI0039A4A384